MVTLVAAFPSRNIQAMLQARPGLLLMEVTGKNERLLLWWFHMSGRACMGGVEGRQDDDDEEEENRNTQQSAQLILAPFYSGKQVASHFIR